MQYWKKLNPDGTINTVESHSFPHKVPDAIEITKEEYDAFIDSLPTKELEPVRDLATEIDELKAKIEKLEPGTPPLCTHWARIDSINLSNEKPVTVKRIWGGKEYLVDCYVTESIKDQYLAGDIAVGDFVLVEFLDDDPNRAVVFSKVLETW